MGLFAHRAGKLDLFRKEWEPTKRFNRSKFARISAFGGSASGEWRLQWERKRPAVRRPGLPPRAELETRLYPSLAHWQELGQRSFHPTQSCLPHFSSEPQLRFVVILYLLEKQSKQRESNCFALQIVPDGA